LRKGNKMSIKYSGLQWRAEGGADGATAPGIHPGGHEGASFLKNILVNDQKRSKKVVTGA